MSRPLIPARMLNSLSPSATEAIQVAPGNKGIVSPFEATGRSGIRHAFTLGKTVGTGADLACDVVISEDLVDETKVLSLFIRAYDVGVRQAILCVSPTLTPDAKKLADTYRIKVIEGRNEAEATDRLVSFISQSST